MSTKTAKHSWFCSRRLRLSSWSTQALLRKNQRRRRRSKRCSLISNRSPLCQRPTATRKRKSRRRSKTSSKICHKILSNSCNSLKSTRYLNLFLSVLKTFQAVLNQILRQSSTPLVDGPFSVLTKHIRLLDFDIKRRYFRKELDKIKENTPRGDTAIHVNRETIFDDSFRELHRKKPEDWKGKLYIVFNNEEGQDAGGLLREW